MERKTPTKKAARPPAPKGAKYITVAADAERIASFNKTLREISSRSGLKISTYTLFNEVLSEENINRALASLEPKLKELKRLQEAAESLGIVTEESSAILG